MDFYDLPTPCYVVDENLLIKNLEVLKNVADSTGCRILLAQKAFSMYSFYPLIGQYLNGTAASGLFEARLGAEEMGKENHIFSPAYREEAFDEIVKLCGHIIFNSFSQMVKFKEKALNSGKSIGLRINPEFSTQESHEIYDPCAPGSRLGITIDNFNSALSGSGPNLLDGVSGLHFHTLCEQDAGALIATAEAAERKFGKWFGQMKWLNFGGGHHITRPGYDIPALKDCIKYYGEKYGVQIYLEPGEAVALNAGFFITSVLDVINNGIDIAILDCSAACHMPDVLEMPYRPPLLNSFNVGDAPYTYRFGGMTCLAGDVIGEYSFDRPLTPGEKLVFADMAIYSMVKNNTFNGMPLPSIAIRDKNGDCRIVKSFGYDDFKSRL